MIDMTKEEFFERTGQKIKGIGGIDGIISFKEATRENIIKVEWMEKKFLDDLLRNVPLLGSGEKCYKDAEISVYKMDPRALMIGQTFLQESKLINLLNVSSMFEERWPGQGLIKSPPLIVYIKKDGGIFATFYVPPISEIYDSSLSLIDGLHRSYIAIGGSATANYVSIKKKKNDLPFTPHDWREIMVMKEKPPKEERFFDLRKENFRVLDYVGIDG
jgi:hypothetical protein